MDFSSPKVKAGVVIALGVLLLSLGVYLAAQPAQPVEGPRQEIPQTYVPPPTPSATPTAPKRAAAKPKEPRKKASKDEPLLEPTQTGPIYTDDYPAPNPIAKGSPN